MVDRGVWTGTWGSSPAGLPTLPTMDGVPLAAPMSVKCTIRYRLRVSLGGSQIRLKFSNEYGNTPLALAGVTVGPAAEGLAAQQGSLRRVAFNGKDSVGIPSGGVVSSDPVDLAVPPLGDLIVSLSVAEGVSVRPILSGVDVRTDGSRKVIVALGDSLTEGWNREVATGERGWPGALARRLRSRDIAVVNAGISGNRLLRSLPMYGASALERLHRDALVVPSLTHLIVSAGINDIGMSGPDSQFEDAPLVSPEAMIVAYTQIIRLARARGVRIFGATLMPFAGAQYYSTDKEWVRQSVNEWLRSSRAFDAVIDFDRAARDPVAPHRLSSEYDSGDHLHLSSEGYRKLGESIDPRLFA